MSDPTSDNPYATPTAATEEPPTPAENVSNDDRNLAVLCHVGTLVGYAIPFGNVAVPLILWFVRKEQSTFVGDNARESLNFQLTLCIYAVVCFVLVFVLIGFLLLFGLAIFHLFFLVKASLAARRGEVFRYPLTIRFIS